MKTLNTKIGVVLTTYTQQEVDAELEIYTDTNESDAATIFLNEIKSFNSESSYYITEEEAIELTGLEMKVSDENPEPLYTNYKGNPLGLPKMNGVELYYTDPVLSLKSAFEIAATDFDFEDDYFHSLIEK